jgi:hypothetical protein
VRRAFLLTTKKEVFEMSAKSKKSPANNNADQKNANKGTSGQNEAWSKRNGNRGKQLNPNQNK